MAAFQITVFSDFSCPYSYLTETALRRAAEAAGTEIRYRAFELFPGAEPLDPPPSEGEGWRLATELAEEVSIALLPASFRPRTGKAHEAVRFAAERGYEPELRAEIFTAYWGSGRDIGRIDTLIELAAGVGLEPEELKIALDIDRYAEGVAHDRDVALRLQVPGTPTLFLGTGPSARVIAGAHGLSQLKLLIENAIRSRTE